MSDSAVRRNETPPTGRLLPRGTSLSLGCRQGVSDSRGEDAGSDGPLAGDGFLLDGLPGVLQNRGSVRLGGVLSRNAQTKSGYFWNS